MTACVNNQNENKGGVSHKVLRSVVAGVMAVSMVPSVALADTTTESEATVLTAQSDAAAFGAATVTKAVDANGNELAVENGVVTLTATGQAQTVTPTQVKLPNGRLVDLVNGNGTTWTTTYALADEDGEPSGSYDADLKNVGTYCVKVTDGSGMTNESLKVKINAASLEGAYIYEGNFEKVSSSVWNGSQASQFHIGLGDEALTTGTGNEVSVQFVGYGITYSDTQVVPAGSYDVVISGNNGTKFEGQKVTLSYKIETLDLNDVTMIVNDIKTGNTPSVTFVDADGEEISALSNDDYINKEIVNVDDEEQTGAISDLGTYTVNVSAKTGQSNVAGSVSKTFRVVSELATNYKYDDADVQGKEITIDADGSTELTFTDSDIAKGRVFNQQLITADLGGSTLTYKDFDITVTKDGKTVNSYTELGTYVVEIKVANTANYDRGGSASFTFEVTKDTFDKVSTYVDYNDKMYGAGETISYTYDGGNVADAVDIVVKDSEGNELKSGTDYKVTWYKDAASNGANIDEAADKAVDEVVNAGAYLLEIKGITYSGSDVLQVNVAQCEPTYLRVAGTKTVYFNGKDENGNVVLAKDAKTGLPYTGEVIVPVLEYITDTNIDSYDKAKDVADSEWKTLPTEAYELTIAGTDSEGKATDKMLEPGTYTLTIADTTPEVDNFDMTTIINAAYGSVSKIVGYEGRAAKVVVLDETCFKDVKASDWFAAAATTAANMGIFQGNDGGAFMPNSKMTRAEAVQVLSNMAQVDYTNKDLVEQYKQEAAKAFSDVETTDWYAAAVGWAKTVGLVQGNGEGLFNPDNETTREQFAVMMANYETTFGNYVAADADALDGAYSDAASISSWAKDAVAWAVANKVMGANDTINPQGVISRAEAATMVVNHIG